MKFDKKYPNAEYLKQCGSMLKGKEDNPQPCWNCKELTTWVDMDFQAYLCSEECLAIKNKEYCEAFGRQDER